MTEPENSLTFASPTAGQLYHSLLTALHPLELFDER